MVITNIILFSITKSGKELGITFQWKTRSYHFIFTGFKLIRKDIRDFGKANECLLEREQIKKLVQFEDVSYKLDEEGLYDIIVRQPKIS